MPARAVSPTACSLQGRTLGPSQDLSGKTICGNMRPKQHAQPAHAPYELFKNNICDVNTWPKDKQLLLRANNDLIDQSAVATLLLPVLPSLGDTPRTTQLLNIFDALVEAAHQLVNGGLLNGAPSLLQP